MIKIDKISYKVPSMERKILDNISITLQKGDFLIILGSNGSGKSSLINCLNGQLKPQSGSITVDGPISTLQQNITSSTFKNLSVLENCYLAKKQSKEEIIKTLSFFHPDLPKKLYTAVEKLSGGQRQCLALALSAMQKPTLLLLDEHTSALDPINAEKIMQITNNLHQENKSLTIAMTTHNLDDALTYGNRLIGMQQGKCIFEVNHQDKNQLTKKDLLKFY